MQYAFLPVFLFVVCAIGLAAGLLVVAGLFNPGRPGRVTRMPYESGMDPIHDTRRRFDVRFHLLAIAFLVFDVELLFLYPWAVAMKGERGEWRGEREKVASDQWPVTSRSAIENPRLEISNPQSLISGSSALSSLPSPLSPSSGIDAAVAHGWVESRNLVFGGVMTFLVLLTLGFVYDWRKGVFQWR
jgi:NADH-quinone oxidoreductase subunit A